MTPRALFSVGVRLIGLISLIFVCNSALGLIGIQVPWELVLKIILWFFLSIWMLRGAPLIVRFSYHDGE
jgi:hypothetical protein